MEELVIALKKVLANTYAFGLKTQNYHWNVTGPDFKQYHDLFGDIYQEVYGSIDTLGEEIRALGDFAPASFARFGQLSDIEDELKVPVAIVMFERLIADNEKVLASIESAYELAEVQHKHGLSNILAERQDAHAKHAWMLSATAKR